MAEGRGSAPLLVCLIVIFLAASFLFPCFIEPASAATLWTVGGSSGWNTGVNYTEWTQGKTFRVGDTLFFPYTKELHDVVVVNKSEYDACTTAANNQVFTNGNTNITLNSTGNMYYLCSLPGHCNPGGMKLAVDVVSASAPPSPSAPTPSPPSSAPSLLAISSSSIVLLTAFISSIIAL